MRHLSKLQVLRCLRDLLHLLDRHLTYCAADNLALNMHQQLWHLVKYQLTPLLVVFEYRSGSLAIADEFVCKFDALRVAIKFVNFAADSFNTCIVCTLRTCCIQGS